MVVGDGINALAKDGLPRSAFLKRSRKPGDVLIVQATKLIDLSTHAAPKRFDSISLSNQINSN